MKPLWQTAERVTGFTQRDPNQGAVPSESTVVYIAYDDAALYIGARLYDSHPDSIVARLARRDQGTSSDRFQVYLDSYHDKRSGFYFGINAAGTLYDGTFFNDDWDDDTWDGVWEGKVTRDAQGWIAELRIPYSQLRFVSQNQYVWGVNFRRDIARKNEFDYIVYTPRDGRGFVSRFPDLVGIERIAPPMSFGKQDFNFKSLRGNAVLRWEYMPGSTLYFVWTQSRQDFESIGNFNFGSSMGRMLRAPADNILMIKARYWWNP